MELSNEQLYELFELAKRRVDIAEESYNQGTYDSVLKAMKLALRAHGIIEVSFRDRKNLTLRPDFLMLKDKTIDIIELVRTRLDI